MQNKNNDKQEVNQITTELEKATKEQFDCIFSPPLITQWH